MDMSSCEARECDEEFFYRYSCNYCGGSYCSSHRLPENHDCPSVSRPQNFKEAVTTSPTESIDPAPMDTPNSLAGKLWYYPVSLLFLLIATLIWVVQWGVSIGKTLLGIPIYLLKYISSMFPGSASAQALTIVLFSGVMFAGAMYFAPDPIEEEPIEREIHHEVNDRRIDHDLQELQWEDRLHAAAKNHSEDMAERGYYSHSTPDGTTMRERYLREDISCRGIQHEGWEAIHKIPVRQVEEIDGGSEYLESNEEIAEYIVDEWMNSPDHRRILLSEYSSLQGVGIHYDESEKQVFATLTQC